MKKENLIQNEYYIGQYGKRKRYILIYTQYSDKLKFNSDNIKSKTNEKEDFYMFQKEGSFRFNDQFHILRVAAPLEKAQLDACIKADKFIPLKDVTPTNVGIEYEIY
jgi:hypothetical protein